MELGTYVKQRVADGALNALQIHADIVRPSVVSTTGKEARKTATLEGELRGFIVPDLMTLNLWNTTAPENREELVETRLLNRKAAAADVATYVSLDMLEARIAGHVRRIIKRGGEPYGADAGKAERDTTTTTEGPALWQTWGIEKPTLRDVREAMR